MISCTEFIPAYSELFKHIDEHHGGYAAVQRFWDYLFKPDGKGIPLINFIKEKGGLRGAFEYWYGENGTLMEEACDAAAWFNFEQGWARTEEIRCPSKGCLLKLKEELGVEPYAHYCDHCNYYRGALEEGGIIQINDNFDTDRAACRSYMYDPKIFKGLMQPDENTVHIEIHSSDREYFHKDFHSSMNMGIEYLAANFGVEDLVAYLTAYTNAIWVKHISAAKQDGIAAIEKRILDIYRKEHAEDAVNTAIENGTLTVEIAYCPAVKHLHATGREVSEWFSYATTVPMGILAAAAGKRFILDSYDKETGAAKYRFAD